TRTANGRSSTRRQKAQSVFRPDTRSRSRSTRRRTSPTILRTPQAEYRWPVAYLIHISTPILGCGGVDHMVNRVTNELSELGDDLAIIESFSHCVAFDSGDGVVCFDASGVHTGEAVVAALKNWRAGRVAHLFYTHGHADHVGGSTYFAAD